jgi:diguanylate cyclase (GGDEF)-like protein
MESSPVDLMPKKQLIGYITTWIAAFVLMTASILALEYNGLKTRFNTLGNNLAEQAARQLKVQQTGLESFTHSLSTQPGLNPALARETAESLIKYSPNLYMFAIASRVEADQRESFEQRMSTEESRGFRIQPPADAADARTDLYPVVLLIPERPEARMLLGMDLAHQPSVLSGRLSGKVAPEGMSKPIMLGDGPGYLLYQALDLPHSQAAGAKPQTYAHYALLAVSAQTLFAPQLMDEPGLSLQLVYPGSTTEARTVLFEHRNEPGLPLPIPSFERTLKLNQHDTTLSLQIRYQPGWQVLNHWQLAGLLGGLVLLMFQVGWLMQRVRRTRRLLLEQQKSLYNKAHYDHLTGLPNTNLLLDRLEQAIRSAQRTSSRVAVFFLDLDDFKQVNDAWGHDIGDQLLIQIGVRLRESMRSEDTIARIHGDEFVILIPVFNGERQLNKIHAKLEGLFELPFMVGEVVLQQSGSFGLAVFPEDADDAEGLLGLADRQMYLRKQSRSQENVLKTAIG